MTEKKAIKAAKRLKKYCASFDTCTEKCVFRNNDNYKAAVCYARAYRPKNTTK